MELKFERLSIWRTYDGELEGGLTVRGNHGETKFKISGDRAHDILRVVADLMVDGAREMAAALVEESLAITGEAEPETKRLEGD